MEKPEQIKQTFLPPQVVGKETGAAARVVAGTREAAVSVFEMARNRLMNINEWNIYTGMGSATFQLVDEKGNASAGPPEQGQLIRIDIPGPGTIKGSGFDWVLIETIENELYPEEDTAIFAFRVRPVSAPLSDEAASSHFFTSDATSTFIVMRKGNEVVAEERGRNEVPNDYTRNLIDRVRNLLVGLGASHGLSHLQWKSLMEGVLKK